MCRSQDPYVDAHNFWCDGICKWGRCQKRHWRAWSLSLPCEDTTIRQPCISSWSSISRCPSASQEESSQQAQPGKALSSQTSGHVKCEKINFYCLSHPIYDILLWQHKLTRQGCFCFWSKHIILLLDTLPMYSKL